MILMLSSAPTAHSASLGMSPSSGQYQVGKNFTVNFLANTDGQIMNASSGVITFPTNNLEVVSISKTGSIFSLWVQEPSFSNSAGTINFEGVVLNPGYSGNGGKLLSVTFRPKSPGTAQVKFSSGSILANDGLGTNIASTLSSGNFTITEAFVEPKPETPKPVNNNAPVISSETHPDQNGWYNKTTAIFNWELPQGALETKLLIGRNQNSTPTVSYIPPVSTKTIEDLGEGTYYFSVQTRTTAGWSSVGRFKLNIDTKPPQDFDVSVNNEDTSPKLTFITDDIDSGFSHYEIKIGGGEIIRIDEQEVINYELPPIYSGEQNIAIIAFDKAGNQTIREVIVSFGEALITKPIITEYPEEIEQGKIITIQGSGTPDNKLLLTLTRKGNVVYTEEGIVDGDGRFSFAIGSHLDLGYHTAFVQAYNEDTKLQSNPVAFKVEPSQLLGFAISFVSYLGIAILVVIGIASFIKIILYFTNDLKRTARFLKHHKEEGEKDKAVKPITSPSRVSKHTMKF